MVRVLKHRRQPTRSQVKRVLRKITALHPAGPPVYFDEATLVAAVLGDHTHSEHRKLMQVVRRMVKRGDLELVEDRGDFLYCLTGF